MDREALKASLLDHEGEVLHAYRDHLGYLTIGVGHLIDERRGGGIPQHISRALLEYDIDEKERELDQRMSWWRTLDGSQQRALLEMAFQLGVDGLLGFSRMLAALHRGDRKRAYREALDSAWASQTPRRAKAVARLLL